MIMRIVFRHWKILRNQPTNPDKKGHCEVALPLPLAVCSFDQVESRPCRAIPNTTSKGAYFDMHLPPHD